MKKIIRLLIVFTVIFSAVLFVQCADKNEREISFEEIVFESKTFDVCDAMDYVVFIGNNNVKSVVKDGDELKENEYLVKNGYFALALNNVGEMGLGKHDFSVEFGEGVKNFGLEVVDEKNPQFDLDIDGMNKSIGYCSLPKIRRLQKYQEYSEEYALSFNGETLPLSDNGDSFSSVFNRGGSYKYTVTISRYGKTTEYDYDFEVVDKYDYSDGKNYASEESVKFWAADGRCEWNESENSIDFSSTLKIDGGLIARAKFDGMKYLKLSFALTGETPEYVWFNYDLTGDKLKSGGTIGNFYSTAGQQTVTFDISEVEAEAGEFVDVAVTTYGPISVYNAVFVENMINEDVNYSGQAYQKQKIWWSNTCDQESGYALWDYRAGDIMELWTSGTMFFKTEILKAATEAGFKYLLLEGTNLSSGVTAYYNEKLQDFGRTSLTAANCKNNLTFSGSKIVVKMDIEAIKNSNNDFTALVGVDGGKIVITGLRFLKEDIAVTNESGVIYKNEKTETVSLKTTEELSIKDIKLEADGKFVGFELYLDGIKVKSTAEKLTFSAGTYYMTAKSLSEPYTIAVCKIVCSEPLDVDGNVIIDEFCSEEYIDYFYDIYKIQFGYENNSRRLTSGGGIGIRNEVVIKAREAGYDYLEITFGGSSSWISVFKNPTVSNVANVSVDNDGVYKAYSDMCPQTVVIDMSGITAEEGYTEIAKVNQYSVWISHARFVNQPITENVNYGGSAFCYESAIDGKFAGNNPNTGFKWAQNQFAPAQKYLGINTDRTTGFSSDVGCLGTSSGAEAGGLACSYINKNIVKQAIDCGFTKITVTCIVMGADKIYYWDSAKEYETGIVENGTSVEVANNSVVTVTVSLETFDYDNWSWDWVCVLPAVTQGNIMYSEIRFCK